MILEAEFNIRNSRMMAIIAAMDARTGGKTEVAALSRAQGNKCMVIGEAQQVMFVIGEIAAQGEDGLTFVHEAS